MLEQLELEQADLVTMSRLDELVRSAGVGTQTRTVAARLRERGWLLSTGQRGVWEFAPAAVAGAYSRGGPTRLLRAALARTAIPCGLTFQAAAWALGLADRAPGRVEVAAADDRSAAQLPAALDVSVFMPQLPYGTAKGVPVLRPASVLTHMAATPTRVRSWASALEWLPEVAAEATEDDVLAELDARAATVSARLGYLIQGLRPDIAARIIGPKTKTWFGRRSKNLRHDSRWQIADTLLPFDPRALEPVS
ncbi:MAG TPA: type IV toxin-antitoxin system AbiEi family antitoxin [Candidatus Limnocylindrales bacterium]|nr:type IV toxin-antitoxin system AbiEi family antitoxin [Candidatus Limnocylindrales bacterium]